MRADLATTSAVEVAVVVASVPMLPPKLLQTPPSIVARPCSTSDESGDVGREVCALKDDGRRREVNDGEGGKGIGGLL